jgi:hypothetical protein
MLNRLASTFHALPAGLMLLLSAAALSGCDKPGTRTGQMSIDRSFTTDGFRWDTGATVYIFVKVRENQGKVEVCAAHMATQGTAYTARLHEDVLAAGIVTVQGDRVLRGLRYSNRLPEMDVVIGQAANCVRSSTAWKPGYGNAEIDIVFPRMNFVI